MRLVAGNTVRLSSLDKLTTRPDRLTAQHWLRCLDLATTCLPLIRNISPKPQALPATLKTCCLI